MLEDAMGSLAPVTTSVEITGVAGQDAGKGSRVFDVAPKNVVLTDGVVELPLRVVGNPGWYEVVLRVAGVDPEVR